MEKKNAELKLVNTLHFKLDSDNHTIILVQHVEIIKCMFKIRQFIFQLTVQIRKLKGATRVMLTSIISSTISFLHQLHWVFGYSRVLQKVSLYK